MVWVDRLDQPKFVHLALSPISSGMLLVSFWFSSVVDCVCKHIHTKLLWPRSLPTPSF